MTHPKHLGCYGGLRTQHGCHQRQALCTSQARMQHRTAQRSTACVHPLTCPASPASSAAGALGWCCPPPGRGSPPGAAPRAPSSEHPSPPRPAPPPGHTTKQPHTTGTSRPTTGSYIAHTPTPTLPNTCLDHNALLQLVAAPSQPVPISS